MGSLPSRLVAATVLAGLLSGAGAIAFHFLADVFGDRVFAWGAAAQFPSGWHVVLIPTLGLFAVGLVLQYLPESRLGGVREVIESIGPGRGVVPAIRIVNVILSGLVLALGGSVGPEGPMVQMGALAGSLAGRATGLSGEPLRLLVRAGAAAGISAAFRSPAGGVLLTLEIFGARFDRGLTAIVCASAIGYMLRTGLLGDAHPFRPPSAVEPLPLAGILIAAPLMGLAAAPAGHAFIRLFQWARTWFPQSWPLSLRVGFGGLLVGLIGLRYPQVMSAGYPVIHRSIHPGLAVDLFVLLMALKMLATSITFGSGAVGGLFAPTLVIGALYGGAWGYGLHALAPALVPQPELLVLLGMICMFGSIIKGYWSGLLMVADLSGCYHQLLLPGAIAGGLSFLLSWRIYDRSIFGLPIEPAAEGSAPVHQPAR